MKRSGGDIRARCERFVGPLATLVFILAWLWPIGLGGKMPVGGDATQFSLGLFAVLSRSLRRSRFPVWNSLWGYGFPGLAESQMGAYYPPHWFLYGLLPLEIATVLNLCLHACFAAIGAYWAARQIGSNRTGAWLSGISFAGCGFFLIHLPHYWAYTTGSWIPWALGLTWSALHLEARPAQIRAGLRLSAVLALQLLPGHFQLAFETQIAVLLLIAWSFFESPRRRNIRRFLPLLSTLFALAMASAQLMPTWRLARLAESRRDQDYLSGFAVPPPHLINYLAPQWFHRSQLWRPVIWDPFRSSPEEHLGYVGLVATFFAVREILFSFRRDPTVRALSLLGCGSLILAMGPYAPFFSWYSRLPGFSFFRAPARWEIITAFCLAMLAGKGWSISASRQKIRQDLLVFSLGCVITIAGAVALGDSLLNSGKRRATIEICDTFLKAMLPEKNPPSFRALLFLADSPQGANPTRLQDLRVRSSHAREHLGPFPAGGQSLRGRYRALCVLELSETAIVVLGMIAVAALGRTNGSFKTGCIVLIVLDMLLLSRHRLTDLGPVEDVRRGSPILERLFLVAEKRVIGTLGNLPMAIGLAPLPAYRTLDLPVRPDPVTTSLVQWTNAERLKSSMKSSGASFRLLDPLEMTVFELLSPAVRKKLVEVPGLKSSFFEDRKLASWLLGKEYVAASAREWSRFGLFSLIENECLAWETDRPLPQQDIARIEEKGFPLRTEEIDGEHFRVDLPKRSLSRSRRLIVITRLFDEPWQGLWIDSRGSKEAIRIFRLANGWQGAFVPNGQAGELHLEYRDNVVAQSRVCSFVCWAIWLGLVLANRRAERRENIRKENRS